MVFREKMKDGTTRLSGNPLSLLDIFNAVYPVGSIHMSVTNTNPGTQFGGTWVAWGSGRVPVGVDGAQTEFDVVEKTGGEKTHVLTTAEMPSHSHTINHTHPNATASSAGAHTHQVDGNFTFGIVATTVTTGAGNRYTNTADANTRVTASDGAHTHTVPAQAFAGSSAATGGDGSHNNLQPYITCYMWKRTA